MKTARWCALLQANVDRLDQLLGAQMASEARDVAAIVDLTSVEAEGVRERGAPESTSDDVCVERIDQGVGLRLR